MRRLIRSLVRRWADAQAVAQIADLERQVKLLEVTKEVLEAQAELLSGVVARDRARIRRETQIEALGEAKARAGHS